MDRAQEDTPGNEEALKHRVTSSGSIVLLCTFHREKTPSLRIWRSGWFFCHGCQERGHVSWHADLERLFFSVHGHPHTKTDKNQLELPLE